MASKEKQSDDSSKNQDVGSIKKQPRDLKSILTSEAMYEQFAKALPKHLSVERFTRITCTALLRTPMLAECTHESFFKCLLDLSAMGLEPDGVRAHLIPFRNNKKGTVECTLIIDYKGLVELVRRSGDVAKINADVICENDTYDHQMGEVVSHTFSLTEDRGAPIAAYAQVKFRSGEVQCVIMTSAEIEAIRSRSKSRDSGPWVTDWREMAKKGLAVDTPIPTPDGWSTMGELSVGDRVFDKDGNQTTVIAVSEIKNLPCFRVNFTNGDSIVCDDEHRWLARCGGGHACKQNYAVMTVNEIYDALADGMSATIPVQKSLELPDIELPIDPYLLGYWLGDGTSRSPKITCGSEDLDHVKEMVEKSKYQAGRTSKAKNAEAHSVGIRGGMLLDLLSQNLLGNKHVPAIYMRASKNQRLALLSGLMDSGGHIDKDRGRAHFCSIRKCLADAVEELVLSLGDVPFSALRTNVGFNVTCNSFFVGWKPTLCPVRIPRKMANFQPRKITKYRAIASVESIESVATKCIAVDSSSETYLAGRSMAVTHNTTFRRLCKWLTLSPEVHQYIAADDESQFQHQRQPALIGMANQRVVPIDPFSHSQEAESNDSDG